MQPNSYFVPLLREYLSFFKIYPNSQKLHLVLKSSPSYPSVLSIVQTCIYFGLKTKAYKADYDALLKNSMPAIVHLKEKSSEKFVMVEKVTDNILVILFYLSACATPFILFSVLYQKIVVKKWCPLCLSVTGIIILEICLFLFYPSKASVFNYVQPFILLLFSFIISILILCFFKRFLQQQIESLTDKTESLRIKRNPLILASVFNRQQQTVIPQNHQIIIGNQQAPVVITSLLNPMCQPCAKKVKSITMLLEKYPQKFFWQIRFDGIETNEYHPINQMQLHLIQLCNNKTDDMKLQIMTDWYRKQSMQWFSKRYPVKEIIQETIVCFAEQKADNKLLNIKKVPTIWMNNREFPEEYSVKDIPFLLTDIDRLLELTK